MVHSRLVCFYEAVGQITADYDFAVIHCILQTPRLLQMHFCEIQFIRHIFTCQFINSNSIVTHLPGTVLFTFDSSTPHTQGGLIKDIDCNCQLSKGE